MYIYISIGFHGTGMFPYINGWSHSFRLSPLCNLWSFFVAPHLSGAWIFVRKVHLVSNQPGRASVHPPFQPKNSGIRIPMEMCVFLFSKKNISGSTKKIHIYVCVYIYVCIYVYVAEVKKGRCTSNQQNGVFLKNRFNLEDLLVSNSFFFGGCTYFRS